MNDSRATQLFGELRAPLLRYAARLGVPGDTGEDLVQDVFLNLFHHLRRQKPDGNLRAWTFRVAHNLALKLHRRPRLDSAEAALEVPDPALDPEASACLADHQRRVRAIVAALSERDRQCLLLRAEGRSYREIAAALGVSTGTVAASLARALDKVSRHAE